MQRKGYVQVKLNLKDLSIHLKKKKLGNLDFPS